MPSTEKARARKAGPYHHGDLRAALTDTAIELIGERGVRNFSMAEASRRLGVAASAPYAHFADRDALLAAVKVRAYDLLAAELPGIEKVPDPAGRLAGLARAYIRFAASNRALFEVVYQVALDKARYPEVETAERPVTDFLLECVRALTTPGGDGGDAAGYLATALEATARGHAVLLLEGEFGDGPQAVSAAAERAARATLALVAGRHLLR